MQLKLLQAYKVLGNFSTALIMEFIPFIILCNMMPVYSLEKSIAIMFLFWALQSLFMYLFNIILKKVYEKKPQIFLLLRIVPIIVCEICILFLYTNNIFVIIITAIFSGLENSFNWQPLDIIWNYATENTDERTLAFTSFLDQMAWLAAGIVGGFFLDNIPQSVVVIFSLILFIGAALPLFIYYFKNKNTPYFNTDFVSNIVQNNQTSEKVINLRKSFIKEHFITTVLVSPAIYTFYYITTALIYLESGSFFITGIVNSLYDGVYGIACLYCGKFLTKVDGQNYVTAVLIYMIASMIAIFLIPNLIVQIVIFVLCAFIQPIFGIYRVQNFLDKARILGVGNEISINSSNGNDLSNFLCYASGIFGITSIVIFSVVSTLIGTIAIRKTDERITKNLVDILSNNDS